MSSYHPSSEGSQSRKRKLNEQFYEPAKFAADGTSSPSHSQADPMSDARSLEESFCLPIQRNTSASARGANTRYRCKFCGFEFIGGPQKIRVHLAGMRENNTRLSACEKVPLDVRQMMVNRIVE